MPKYLFKQLRRKDNNLPEPGSYCISSFEHGSGVRHPKEQCDIFELQVVLPNVFLEPLFVEYTFGPTTSLDNLRHIKATFRRGSLTTIFEESDFFQDRQCRNGLDICLKVNPI